MVLVVVLEASGGDDGVPVICIPTSFFNQSKRYGNHLFSAIVVVVIIAHVCRVDSTIK